MPTVETARGTYVSVDKIVSIDMITFDKMSPRRRLDWNSRFRTKAMKIGTAFTLVITTTDGTTHRLDETRSAGAYEVLFHPSA